MLCKRIKFLLTGRQMFSEVDFRLRDMFILLEWYVAADHVVKEDTERPYRGWFRVVAMVEDPLWGAVYTGSWKHKYLLQLENHCVIIKEYKVDK